MFLGMIYHDDTETSDSNYIGFAYGETVEETKEKLNNLLTPKYTENIKIFEFGKDVHEKLHQDLMNENLDLYYSECSFWCGDNLEYLLQLEFTKTEYKSYGL